MSFLFKNLNLLDPHWTEARGGYEVLVEGDTIKEVSPKPIRSKAARVIDCGKRTLMPGLIDCHVHTHHSEVYINRMEAVPLTLMMARSAGRLKRMLDRGFTTVRDAGGADWGTKTAVESRLIPGPRMFTSLRKTWTWQSIRPGIRVRLPQSTARALAALIGLAETSLISSPSTRTS